MRGQGTTTLISALYHIVSVCQVRKSQAAELSDKPRETLYPGYNLSNMRYQAKIRFKEDFVEEKNGVLIVGIRALPEKGKANRELILKLARHFKIDGSRIKIVSGLNSRNKVVEIKQP